MAQLTPAGDASAAGGSAEAAAGDEVRRPWTLAEIATIASDLARLEHQLFVVLGEAARSVDPPLPPDVLATWCHRHAWHADLWAQRTPVVAGWFGSDPPATWNGSAGIEHAVAALDADGFAAVTGAVAMLDEALASIAARTDSVTDPATARVLALTQRDVADERTVFRP